jgi:acetyl-CoA C-acetyltransferase
MAKEVFIVSAVRTPIGSFGGCLKSLSATALGAIAIKGAIEKANIDPALIDEVIMGSVIQAGLGQAPARQASKAAGLPDKVISTTINKVCASGMKAIAMATQNILLGDAEIVIAGGMESMSNVPFYNTTQRWGNKYGDITMQDGLAKDGLVDAYDHVAMGNFADLCAKENNISRDKGRETEREREV